MALEGKKITIPDDTPVQILAAGPTAYDLTVKPGRRVFIGTSASMTKACALVSTYIAR